MLAANIVLALLWVMVLGPFTPGNMLVGYLIGFALLWLAAGGERSGYIRRTRATVFLGIYTVVELIKSNLRVARFVLSPLRGRKPAVLAVPLPDDATDTEITLLANLITLTPGTLTMDVAEDRSAIFVHFIHVDDPEAEIAAIKDGFERRILEATR